ncbi:MAG TPA: metallophosphoesterase [Bryobacteraceae bacterium]|jgi:predicted MPP superfamily phosphohydrolase|nr:metallophosphoesterase [Bryobacteraceae bacterium]
MEVVLDRLLRALPDLFVLIVSLLGQIAGVAWLIGWRADGASRRTKILIAAAGALSMAASLLAFLLRFHRVARHFSGWWIGWGTGLAITWAMLSLCWLGGYFALWIASRMVSGHSPARRRFLQTAYAAVFAAPPAALAYGAFVERHQLFLREQKLEIPNLAPELDGLRLVQLTDIHLSPFLSRAELQRAVDMANETHAHIALVTGDLITTFRDPLDDCLDILAQLRAAAGVFGCMGNHEIYANAEAYVEREGARRGMRFLRLAAAPLRFGKAILNLVGVDYQRLHRRYLVGAEKLVAPGALNVLLSHNPDVFPVAARQGYDLTISGHTHGGQIRLELLSAELNPGRFYTPYVDGVYRRGPASIFVSRGIGTIAVPARLGAPPEVSLVRLCRS